MEAAPSLSSSLGRISISHEAVAQIVGRVAAEAYGVVGMAARTPREKLLTRDRLRQGITVGGSAEEGVTIELHVVVEYGLNLAEVASTLAEPCAVRGRAPDRPSRGRGRSAHPGRQEVDRVNDRERVQELAHGALASLERNRQRIDDLNVYPVPDGDTGTNLTMTARSVVDELDRTTTEDRAGLVKEVTRAALMGARGNSGVILSQIIRGAAETLRTDGDVDTHTVASAFRSASDAAYRAVRQPVEGTMLSVIREMAEEGESAENEGLTKPELLARIVKRGEEAVARTPEQLAVLREAGVVDAGGAGLLEIVRGLAATAAGEPFPEAPAEREELNIDAIHQELSPYRYCTDFHDRGRRPRQRRNREGARAARGLAARRRRS